MKKLLIIFVVLTVLAGGALLYAVSRAGAIIEGYKPELEQLASENLGAKVTLGDLSVSIFPRARVVIDSAQVSNPDNPEERIDVAQVSLDLDLMSLLSGTVSISSLRIIEPTITLLMEEDGFFVEGLPRDTQGDSAKEVSGATLASETITDMDVDIAIELKSFVIEQASILIKDSIADSEYKLEELDLKASFSFADNQARFAKVRGEGVFKGTIPFQYTGDGLRYGLEDGVMGLEHLIATTMGSTIAIHGELSPNDAKKEITITSDGVDLLGLDPALTLFAPTAKEFGIHGIVQPKLVFALTPTGYRTSGTLTVSSFGARIEDVIGVDDIAGVYQLEVNEAKQRIASEKLTGTMNGAPFSVKMTATLDETSGTLKPFDITAFGGTTIMTTALHKNDPTFPFESTLHSQGLKVEELIPAFAPDMPFAITGTIETIRAKVSGTLTEDMLPSLKGDGEARLVDGLIHDLNLGQEVLASVKGLPFLTKYLLEGVSPSLDKFLVQKNTVLSEISGTFTLADEQAYSEDMKIVSDFFELNATGTIGLDTRLDLDSIIYFSPEFSAELAAEVKVLDVLLDSKGRLTFPVKISGIPPELTTVPDTSSLLKGAVEKTVRGEVKKQLNKLLKNDGDTPAGAADSTDSPESNLVDSIESGINKLFGGKKKK